jgi:hypothetical protein
LNVGSSELVGSSGVGASIVVSGGVVSTTQVWLAALESLLPASSMARTSKVWDPGVRPV